SSIGYKFRPLRQAAARRAHATMTRRAAGRTARPGTRWRPCRGRLGGMNLRMLGVLLAVVLAVARGSGVQSTARPVNAARGVAAVCAEALGLADLNPLVDPERLKARAADKERRLRELADHVADKDVKNSLVTMADSYVEVQREHFDDLTVVANWAKRNAAHIE